MEVLLAGGGTVVIVGLLGQGDLVLILLVILLLPFNLSPFQTPLKDRIPSRPVLDNPLLQNPFNLLNHKLMDLILHLHKSLPAASVCLLPPTP